MKHYVNLVSKGSYGSRFGSGVVEWGARCLSIKFVSFQTQWYGLDACQLSAVKTKLWQYFQLGGAVWLGVNDRSTLFIISINKLNGFSNSVWRFGLLGAVLTWSCKNVVSSWPVKQLDQVVCGWMIHDTFWIFLKCNGKPLWWLFWYFFVLEYLKKRYA